MVSGYDGRVKKKRERKEQIYGENVVVVSVGTSNEGMNLDRLAKNTMHLFDLLVVEP